MMGGMDPFARRAAAFSPPSRRSRPGAQGWPIRCRCMPECSTGGKPEFSRRRMFHPMVCDAKDGGSRRRQDEQRQCMAYDRKCGKKKISCKPLNAQATADWCNAQMELGHEHAWCSCGDSKG